MEQSEGGDADEEARARRIVIENGFALKSRDSRDWLREMIADPASDVYDDNASAFVRKAEADLPVSRRLAAALSRLFRIRNTMAFKDAIEQYPDEEE